MTLNLRKIRCLFGNHKFLLTSCVVHDDILTPEMHATHQERVLGDQPRGTHVRVFVEQCQFCKKQHSVTEGQVQVARMAAREGFRAWLQRE